MRYVDVREGDCVGGGFGEGAGEGGAEVGGLRCEERGVEEEGGGFGADEEGRGGGEIGRVGAGRELV
jgi:hypothetical protein